MKIKCVKCCDNKEITVRNLDNFVYYDKKYYCKDCFYKLCNEKLLSKRTKHEKWGNALKNIDSLNMNAKSQLHIAYYKDQLYQFLMSTYNITVIPNNVFTRIDQVNKGTYKGMMKKGISYEELLDMWQRKLHFLKKNAVRQKEMNRGINDPHNQIIYDLAILVGKYDSYCRWKRDHELNNEESKIQKDIANKAKLNAARRRNQIKRIRNKN